MFKKISIEEYEELFGNVPIKDYEKICKYIQENFVSKDKIKEKIKEYQALLYSYQKKQEMKLEYVDKRSMNCILAQISILNLLLEEN